jgi:hypothetical protein
VTKSHYISIYYELAERTGFEPSVSFWVVNEAEAEVVRHIFRRYVQLGTDAGYGEDGRRRSGW